MVADIINPMSLSDRKIIITGAASGIGRETALLMDKLGAKLLLIDKNSEELKKTNNMCINKHSIIIEDVTNFKELKEKIINEAKQNGKFDGLAHIAGIPCICPVKVLSTEKSMDVYKINTLSAVELSKIFTHKDVYSGYNGSIVFISSIYGIVGSSSNVAYAISKAGIIGATKSLSMEFATKKIRVNCVAPGFVKTQMKENADNLFDESHDSIIEKMHPLGLGEAIDISNGIAFLMSNAAKWITGAVFNIDGGFTAQ